MKEEHIDLFEHFELLPEAVQDIINNYSDELDYERCRDLLDELEPHGYTFDYYLDAIPFNLRKI